VKEPRKKEIGLKKRKGKSTKKSLWERKGGGGGPEPPRRGKKPSLLNNDPSEKKLPQREKNGNLDRREGMQSEVRSEAENAGKNPETQGWGRGNSGLQQLRTKFKKGIRELNQRGSRKRGEGPLQYGLKGKRGKRNNALNISALKGGRTPKHKEGCASSAKLLSRPTKPFRKS